MTETSKTLEATGHVVLLEQSVIDLGALTVEMMRSDAKLKKAEKEEKERGHPSREIRDNAKYEEWKGTPPRTMVEVARDNLKEAMSKVTDAQYEVMESHKNFKAINPERVAEP